MLFSFFFGVLIFHREFLFGGFCIPVNQPKSVFYWWRWSHCVEEFSFHAGYRIPLGEGSIASGFSTHIRRSNATWLQPTIISVKGLSSSGYRCATLYVEQFVLVLWLPRITFISLRKPKVIGCNSWWCWSESPKRAKRWLQLRTNVSPIRNSVKERMRLAYLDFAEIAIREVSRKGYHPSLVLILNLHGTILLKNCF